MLSKKSKIKSQKFPYSLGYLTGLVLVAFLVVPAVMAVTPTPSAKPTAKPTTSKTSAKVTPTTTPKVTPEPTSIEDEKVKEIRDAIKEKVSEIKDKIEKKAYSGTITQITDSSLTIDNFRGKQRVRLSDEAALIGTNKNTIKPKDFAVDDKIIAMGTVSDNDILDAKRVLVISKPKTTPAKRIVLIGTISNVDTKKSTITVDPLKDSDKTIDLKVDKNTDMTLEKDTKATVTLKTLENGQKVIFIYNESTSLISSLFIL